MLFWEREFRELSESALAEMRQRIRGESADYLLRVNEEDYLQHVIPGFTIDTFAIDFSGVSISSGERDIPGHIFPGQQYDVDPDQFYTKHVVTYHVPVSGELSLLGMRPTQYIDWTAEIDISEETPEA